LLFSTSRKLIQSVQGFLKIRHYAFVDKILQRSATFYGWGRKSSGINAMALAKKHCSKYILLEDGFIRSLGLGIDNSPSFSLVEDDVSIYYDATQPSKLENTLNTYDFRTDTMLMQTAKEAIELIKRYHISKYNNAPDIKNDFFGNDTSVKVLIIAQTAGDASLEYGLGNVFSTKQMIDDAIKENPHSSIYIKIHPDVLVGKKTSDIQANDIPKECTILEQNVNPISLLKHFDKVYTKTSGMGMEALLLGVEVVCYGMPYYSGWGLTEDRQKCDRRARELSVEELFAGAYMLYTKYYNPYTQKESNIIDTVKAIVKYRDLMRQNDGDLYFFGFSRWKRKNTIPFFSALRGNTIKFCNSLEQAISKGIDKESKIYIWGKKSFPEVEKYAKAHNMFLHRVEDGFVRSVSLGSDLTKAYSLVVDSRGIYFDPTQESDLEYLLNTYEFDDDLLARSKALQQYLIKNKISKYNADKDCTLVLPDLQKDQSVVVVPGQVEDDASIQYGANGMTNLALLQKARENAPEAYIIYKPHPDVLAGNRVGHIDRNVALKHCNRIVTDVSLDSVLFLADEVHTMTSLVGFESLIRGKKVYTYGLPFYAGWGLTVDQHTIDRRRIHRTLDELVAAAFILYPRYLDPETNELCEIETLLHGIEKEKKRYNNQKYYRLYIDTRNFISRKIQLIIKVVLGE